MSCDGAILIARDVEGAGSLDPQRGEVFHIDSAVTGALQVDGRAAIGHQLVLALRLIADDASLGGEVAGADELHDQTLIAPVVNSIVAAAGAGDGDVGQRQRIGRIGVGDRAALDVSDITGSEGDILVIIKVKIDFFISNSIKKLII